MSSLKTAGLTLRQKKTSDADLRQMQLTTCLQGTGERRMIGTAKS